MKEEDENSIDNLFKAGFKQAGHDIPYQEEDWTAMEAMLDTGSRRMLFIKKLPLILSAVAALLVLIVGVVFYTKDDKPQQKPAKLAKTILPVKQDTGAYGRPVQQPADRSSIIPLSESALHVKNNTGKIRKSKSFFTLSAAAAGRSDTGNHYTPLSLVRQPPVSATAGSNIAAEQVIAANTVVPLAGEINTAVIPDSLSAPLPTPATTNRESKKTAFKAKPLLTLSFIASPDINSTQGFSQSKLGTNAGLLLTVGLSKKWSISTGAVYADKPYMTTFGNYHQTGYTFKDNPANVTASCVVLDIPINVGYQFYNKNGNRLSLGTGLSSYFMLRERYTYAYADNGPHSPLTYDISNRYRHILGVLNLNATYQRAISSKFDIGLQPYFKLPLTGIGYGDVNLKSAGVAVGLMWNLNTLTKP